MLLIFHTKYPQIYLHLCFKLDLKCVSSCAGHRYFHYMIPFMKLFTEHISFVNIKRSEYSSQINTRNTITWGGTWRYVVIVSRSIRESHILMYTYTFWNKYITSFLKVFWTLIWSRPLIHCTSFNFRALMSGDRNWTKEWQKKKRQRKHRTESSSPFPN